MRPPWRAIPDQFLRPEHHLHFVVAPNIVFTEKMHDITADEDVRTLVHAFYARVLEDELLRPVFVEVARLDFEKHMPTMYRFWGSILLGSGTYAGALCPAQAKLLPHITVEHFDRWLTHFAATV